jgi:HTH-type transcriptional regulator/antitoxin HipB
MRARTAGDISRLVRARRTELGWSQDRAARLSGTSRKWLAEFEAGKPTAEVGLVLQLLDALDLLVDVISRPTPAIDLTAIIEGGR